jgi:hypothetical protein
MLIAASGAHQRRPLLRHPSFAVRGIENEQAPLCVIRFAV